MVSDRLRELAHEVANELQRQEGWATDALEVRDTFDAFVDAALRREPDDALLADWLA